MPITYVGTRKSYSSQLSADPFTLSVVDGDVTAGDILVAVVNTTTTVEISAHASWTTFQNNDNQISQRAFWRVHAGGAEPASYQFDMEYSNQVVWADMFAFRGCDQTTPLGAGNVSWFTGQTADTSHVFASVTPERDNSEICCYAATLPAAGATYTNSDGYTEEFDYHVDTGTNYLRRMLAHKTQESAGPTGTTTFTCGISQAAGLLRFALHPEQAAVWTAETHDFVISGRGAA